MKAFMIILSLVFVSCVTAQDRNPTSDQEACVSTCTENGLSSQICNNVCKSCAGPVRSCLSDYCRKTCESEGYNDSYCVNVCGMF